MEREECKVFNYFSATAFFHLFIISNKQIYRWGVVRQWGCTWHLKVGLKSQSYSQVCAEGHFTSHLLLVCKSRFYTFREWVICRKPAAYCCCMATWYIHGPFVSWWTGLTLGNWSTLSYPEFCISSSSSPLNSSNSFPCRALNHGPNPNSLERQDSWFFSNYRYGRVPISKESQEFLSSSSQPVPAQLCPNLWNPIGCSPCQAPLSTEFSRQEYWSGLPFPTLGLNILLYLYIPSGSVGKEYACNAGDLSLIPGSGRSLREGGWQPTLLFLPGEFHGQRSLVYFCPWGRKESDMTEWLILSLHFHIAFISNYKSNTHST